MSFSTKYFQKKVSSHLLKKTLIESIIENGNKNGENCCYWPDAHIVAVLSDYDKTEGTDLIKKYLSICHHPYIITHDIDEYHEIRCAKIGASKKDETTCSFRNTTLAHIVKEEWKRHE